MEIHETEAESNILYEVLALEEWHQNCDFGLQKISLNNSISNSSSYFNPWKIFEKSKLDNIKFLQTEYAWQLAVSHDGKVIAVLQESLIEIRTAKDEYLSVVARAHVPADQYPQLRKVLWSTDNTFLAVARDNGIVHVFNLLGSIIATLQPFETGTNTHGNNTNVFKPVAGLLFHQPKLKSTKWSSELFVFYNDGHVRSILLSSLDGCDSEENADFSLEHYFPHGITSVASHNLHHTVVIAGNSPSKRDGITVWRVLNDYPYLKIASGFEKDASVSRSFLRFFMGFSAKLYQNTVVKMRISPNGEMLASLHSSGDISLWQYPGIRLIRRWSLSQQPEYRMINPRNLDNSKDENYFRPVDICWWSDTALVVARKSGVVTVCSLTTLDNLLGESPQFLSYSPQISSIYGSRSTVIALECETENNKNKMKDDSEDSENENETSVLQASLQAALYSFTDIERFEPKRKTPRLIQRTYRLLALKSTTPEELYSRKIEQEDYEFALSLAHTYNLDCDLVYQKQWRSTSVSKESIYNCLGKIKNTFWVVNESIRRVPDDIETAKVLLEFGLKKAFINRQLINVLDSQQKKLISLRRQILSFLDSLSLYQKIIDHPLLYNAVDYNEFRRKSPVINTVDLARKENWFGVSIMFTYMGNEVLKYWLPILSNFPETLSPLHYRSLLPEIVGKRVISWDTHRLRNADWSEDDKYKDTTTETEISCEYIYQDDLSLKHFEADVLTPALVEEWYVRRVYEIEKNTGLVEYAFLFASLGREKRAKALDDVLFHLRTLYSLVYIINNYEISLALLESLTPVEQAKHYLCNTTKETFVNDLNDYIYPFGIRCESQRIGKFFDILQGVLLWLSEERLDLPLLFFRANKEKNLTFRLSMSELMRLAATCIYNAKRSDQLENGYKILECLPMRSSRFSLSTKEQFFHNKIDKMENHLEVCDILRQYQIFKSPRWVLENENQKSVAKIIMHDMANYTKLEALNFTELEYDLQQLKSFMFPKMDSKYCFELIAYTQMTSEDEDTISEAANFIQCTKDEKNKIIPFQKSVQLVLKAAKQHFLKATMFDNFSIKLSQTCLNLIYEPHPLVCEELDLIESVQLLQDFEVQVLPMQVRDCTDKMTLIERCLQSKPTAYKSRQRLIQLAHALRIYGKDHRRRECEVLILLGIWALRMHDYEYSRDICSLLLDKNFSEAWPLVRTVSEEDTNLSRDMKQDFLAFAILHCPKKDLGLLTQYRIYLWEYTYVREFNIQSKYALIFVITGLRGYQGSFEPRLYRTGHGVTDGEGVHCRGHTIQAQRTLMSC